MYLCPMQGIYIHIPFCKQACHYCDFHFSTSLRHKEPLLQALHKEIELRKTYLPTNNTSIASIYFGGGTPSLLSIAELEGILNSLKKYFSFTADIEITLEANPDDITAEKVLGWKKAGVNRLSIGVQSFFEEDLLWMNRAHTANHAKTCIDIALQSGIENITADLIYGYPLLTDAKWESNMAQMLCSGISHLSAYSLTVEPKTALAHQIKKGVSPAPLPEKAAQHFEMLMATIAQKGWTHYEISNFCKGENYALHNTNYWKNEAYLGLGPSAHSYNGIARQWNVANNAKYVSAINNEKIPAEIETLSPADSFNEYIMTGLRTMWGIDIDFINQKWGKPYSNYITTEAALFINDGLLHKNGSVYTLTPKGKLLADYIASELFWVE